VLEKLGSGRVVVHRLAEENAYNERKVKASKTHLLEQLDSAGGANMEISENALTMTSW
jgi:hypothetical protein